MDNDNRTYIIRQVIETLPLKLIKLQVGEQLDFYEKVGYLLTTRIFVRTWCNTNKAELSQANSNLFIFRTIIAVWACKNIVRSSCIT